MLLLDQINILPRKFQHFENFHSSQSEITELKGEFKNNIPFSIKIAGQSGNGVTHFCHAVCNYWLERNYKVMIISSEWLAHFSCILVDKQRKAFLNELNTYDVIAIDNIEFNFKKSKKKTDLFYELIQSRNQSEKCIILGCSDLKKDVLKNKNVSFINFQKVILKEPTSTDVFRALKSNISREDGIPEILLYLISSYNGSIQEHLNCLISLRFRLNPKDINLEQMTFQEIDSLFELKKYFKRQQFRKCFFQYELDFSKINFKKLVF
jgi:chromosomal replication initiation ATPase DnaA